MNHRQSISNVIGEKLITALTLGSVTNRSVVGVMRGDRPRGAWYYIAIWFIFVTLCAGVYQEVAGIIPAVGQWVIEPIWSEELRPVVN